MKKLFVAFFLFLMIASADSFSQCAMCKRAAETNYQQQQVAQRKGKSLNHGILYLLSMPYLIGAVGAFMWYKNRKKSV